MIAQVPKPRLSLAVGWFLITSFAGAAVVRADVVAVQGRPMAVNVRITGLKAGQIAYRLSGGQEVERPIEQVTYLQIAGWDVFNDAEKQQREGGFRQAAGNYEKLLAKTQEQPGEALDRTLLVRCRLIRVYDVDGRFDRAVTTYLAVLEKMPEVVETLRPANVPAADSTFMPAALVAVNAAIEKHRGTAAGESLLQWRLTWPGQKPPTPAGGGQPSTAPAVVDPLQALKAPLAEIDSLIKGGKGDEVLARVAALRKKVTGPAQADLFYWEGRAYLLKSEKGTGDDAQRDARRAGLAFMRVVIHFPVSRLAPECLYCCGEICKSAGKPEAAASLYAELVHDYPNAAPWADKARQAMKR
jgi:hypothetical protein